MSSETPEVHAAHQLIKKDEPGDAVFPKGVRGL